MDFIFIFVLGMFIGLVCILYTQKNLIGKKKYGFSKKSASTFDINNSINQNILDIDADKQHANKQ